MVSLMVSLRLEQLYFYSQAFVATGWCSEINLQKVYFQHLFWKNSSSTKSIFFSCIDNMSINSIGIPHIL